MFVINDGSPDDGAIRAFNTLRCKAVAPFGWTRVFWQNIGSAIRFRYDGGTWPQIVVQGYPTYYFYRNGAYLDSDLQAPTPKDHFYINPYPFGTVSCSQSQGVTPGGRCGDAVTQADASAHVPNYILILPWEENQ